MAPPTAHSTVEDWARRGVIPSRKYGGARRQSRHRIVAGGMSASANTGTGDEPAAMVMSFSTAADKGK